MSDFTVTQAADELQVNPQIIRIAIKKKYLNSYKVSPRNTRITQAEFDKFKERGGMLSIDQEQASVNTTT